MFPTVGYLAGVDGRAFCTGTVIGPNTVLTAGHCVVSEGRTTDAADVRFGQGATAGATTGLKVVSRVSVHPSYDGTALANDLAILTLAPSVPLVETPLYEPEVAVGSEMTLVGYGVTDGTTDAGAGTQRNVNVTVAAIDSGTWRYDTMGGRSACRGDSGGPAFFAVGGTLHIAGVTSWGDETCTMNGHYTRIDVYLDWIRTTMAEGASGAPAEPAPGDPPPAPIGDGPADMAGAPDAAGCSDSCYWAHDGICDDGGPGAEYIDCAYGTDCGDCGPRTGDGPDAFPGEPAPGGGLCDDSCYWAYDGECDDGGPGALYVACAYGTDCGDCGPR
jgi:hypothetical protein